MRRTAALVLLSTIAPTGTIAATESAPRGVGPECKWKLPMLFTHLDGPPEMVFWIVNSRIDVILPLQIERTLSLSVSSNTFLHQLYQ